MGSEVKPEKVPRVYTGRKRKAAVASAMNINSYVRALLLRNY